MLICTHGLLISETFFFSELESRVSENYVPIHIININIQDNHDEATFGSFLFYEICQMVRLLVETPTTIIAETKIMYLQTQGK